MKYLMDKKEDRIMAIYKEEKTRKKKCRANKKMQGRKIKALRHWS